LIDWFALSRQTGTYSATAAFAFSVLKNFSTSFFFASSLCFRPS
jgi:hypothetical protein